MKTALPKTILSLLGRGANARISERTFNTLALKLFEYQLARHAPYRKFCSSKKVRSWRDIPAVPTTAFKEATLTTIPPRLRVAEFRSSGTTKLARSRHFHSATTLKLYEASVLAGFQQVASTGKINTGRDAHLGGQACATLIFLTPSPPEAPHSSLVHMMETIRSQFGGDYFVQNGTVENSRLLSTLPLHSSPLTPPVILLGTALAFAQFFDFLVAKNLRLQLPNHSWAMETGGFKGHRREIPRDAFYAQFEERLGLAREQIVSEYGMCELSSQFYTLRSTLHTASVFHGPPWTRTLVMDPETGQEAREGQRGLIRIVDLANIGSVLAVQTEDVGIRRREGFELIGRAPQAEARGCSLMMKD